MDNVPTYFMIDVEASGTTPGKYSMMSLGACVIGGPKRTFYCELQPISDLFLLDYIKIGALHLDANRGNAASGPNFDPALALRNLRQHGVEPGVCMDTFHDWVNAEARGGPAKFVSDSPDFDGMFVRWYADNYGTRGYPFESSSLSMNCYVRGMKGDLGMTLRRAVSGKRGKMAHHAEYDAVNQAGWSSQVLPASAVRRPEER